METFGEYLGKRWKYFLNHRTVRDEPVATALRALLWLAHCAIKKPAIAKLKRWNVLLHLPARLRRVGSTMVFIARENYEPELKYLEKILRPGSVFIDGGANLGIYTVVASSLVGSEGAVYAFEPSLESFQLLNDNVALNNQKNVKTYPLALSNKSGEAKLYHIDNAPTSYSLGGKDSEPVGYETIKITTLDQIAKTENLTRVDAIKLDVEGAEELALKGALNTLSQFRPVVIFEIRKEASDRLHLDNFGAWHLLKKLDYELFVISKKNDDLIALEAPSGSGVYIAKAKTLR